MRSLASLTKGVVAIIKATDLAPLPDDGRETVGDAMRHAILYQDEEIERLETAVAKLRVCLRGQTQQTAITARYISDKVDAVLVDKGAVPDGMTLAGHPCEQNVGTCISWWQEEVEELTEKLKAQRSKE